MARVMIIGAGGQLGNDLVPYLHGQGDDLILVDRVAPENTGAWSTFCKFFGSEEAVKSRWNVVDATDTEALASLIRQSCPQVVYQLAALLSARCEDDPEACWRVNMSSFRNVLGTLPQVDCGGQRPKMIWPSSIAAFGPPFDETGPFEATNEYPLLPRTLYGVTKVSCEMLGTYYAEKKGIDFRSVRFPGLLNTAAPGGGSSDFANAMYFAAANGETSAVSFVGPDARIPFMYMGDAVRALIELAAADEAKLTRRTYNIRSFPSPSAAEIGQSIAREIPGFEVRYELDERARNVAGWPQDFDDSPARRDWGWTAELDDLNKMTRRLLADFRALKG